MGRMRGGGLIATVVFSAGLWLYGHGHGSPATSSSNPYCADVTSVVQLVSGGQSTSAGHPSPAHLAAMGSKLHADAASLTNAGNTSAAAAVENLGTDVDQWQTSIVSDDAVGQTIALDRVLSVVTTVPGC